MKKLPKSDPVTAGCGELQVEIGLQDLRDDDCEFAGCGELHVETGLENVWGEGAQAEFTKSDPVVVYREKVADVSNQICLAKSPTKVKVGKVLPKRVDGLKKLSKSDPRAYITAGENGENVAAGCGELHVEVGLKQLGGPV